MAPKDYIAARNDNNKNNKDADFHVMIDGHPYYPFLKVDASDHSSMRTAVAKLLEKSETSNEWKISAVIREHNEHKKAAWPVSVVQGGITNQLFRVDIDSNNISILVRIFGAEGMIDRDIENATYAALAAVDLAPAYYGRFANGRLEAWLNGMRPLTPREMAKPEIAPKIAEQMALFHSKFQIPEDLQEYHNANHTPSLWTQLHDWMDQAAAVKKFQTKHDTEKASKLNLASIPAELQWLREEVVPKDAEITFCHNDALAANILYSPETNAIRLIDFEYGGMNYTAFDIANHFNEYAGGTDTGITHYEWFPTHEQQREFLDIYLKEKTAGGSSDANPAEEQIISIEDLHNQVQAFVLANHLYWGLWAVNQAATEGCQEFDYLLYAGNRFKRYFECKNKDFSSK